MESIEEKKEKNVRLQRSRDRLFSDSSFKESWTLLITSPTWENKCPGSILSHLDRLTEYPVRFATYLVDRAIELDLPFIVPDNCVEDLFDEWTRMEAENNFVPPTVEEVSAVCREKGYNVSPEAFVKYYECRNWRNQYGAVLTTWKANLVTWHYNKLHYEKR